MKKYLQSLQSIATFLVATTFGSVGFAVLLFFMVFGKVRIQGYWKLWKYMLRGNNIIAANHPSLLEPAMLPLMFWPFGVLWPQRFFLWSMPDVTLMSWWIRAIFWFGHCIGINRSAGANNSESTKKTIRILKAKGNIAIHPEGGRTQSLNKDGSLPDYKYKNERHMRVLTTKLPIIASMSGAAVIPIWVDVPSELGKVSFKKSLFYLLFWRYKISIHVGEPYKIKKRPKLAEENKKMVLRILNA